jgi:hypothetical protein
MGEKNLQNKFVLTDFKVFKLVKEKDNAELIENGGKGKSRKSKFEVPIEKKIGDIFTIESNYAKI